MLRERIAFGVIFIDSARITSPKSGEFDPHHVADRFRGNIAGGDASAACRQD